MSTSAASPAPVPGPGEPRDSGPARSVSENGTTPGGGPEPTVPPGPVATSEAASTSGTGPETAVRVRGLHKSYGELEVLRGIDLDVVAGEVVCLIGPSGSGKSTLLRCLNLLETPQAGSISVDGFTVTDPDLDVDAMRRRVGMVFQQFNLFPHLSVLENCTMAQVKVLKRPAAEARRVALANLRRVGLSEKADQRPAQLSGGQQQRVAIARALSVDPDLMLFDEPTSALDPETVGDVLSIMRGLAADGMTMLVVTHEMSFARDVADRVVFMDGGVVVEQGPAREVIGSPQHQRTRTFLSRVLNPTTGAAPEAPDTSEAPTTPA
ncbi:hypothetical protein GCM10009859_10390 [Kocuria salsicia]